jgi:hypothetical protein
MIPSGFLPFNNSKCAYVCIESRQEVRSYSCDLLLLPRKRSTYVASLLATLRLSLATSSISILYIYPLQSPLKDFVEEKIFGRVAECTRPKS